MPKRNIITEEQLEEIKNARKNNKDKYVEKRLKTLQLHAEGNKRAEIAKQTEFSAQYITTIVSKYCENGLESVMGGKSGGNNRNMSYEEEESILEKFAKEAEEGHIVETGAIKRAYEEKLGRKLNSHSTIYDFLKRHNWRKVAPRNEHPKKASDEDIESSKKLSLSSKTRWQKMTETEKLD
jgi:transposase